ncbi:MAG TPA: aquaporin [Acidimicrobiia bacterium]|nr:aquaporin [Acidimicrobiia bacterium]
MPTLTGRAVAEFLGTFGLIFFGAGAVVTSGTGGFGLLGIALVHAIVLSVMVSSTMAVSGGHLNPAVTIGFLATRRIDGKTAGVYIVSQLIGAIVAALAIKALLPAPMVRATIGGTPQLAGTLTLSLGIAMEAVLTFFLVSAVFGTAVNPNAPKIGGFGIGLTLFFDIMVGGPFTGAAMNPARAFGPSVASGVWTSHAVYWIGPIIGAVAAALLWDRVILPKTSEK